MGTEKAIYAPGELEKVRNRLGPLDKNEAKHMQSILGGEVGRERENDNNNKKKRRPSTGAPAPSRPARAVEVVETPDESAKPRRRRASAPPATGIPDTAYRERIRMDVCCAEPEYGIKTFWQVLKSRLTFFRTPPDMVSASFVTGIIGEYYKQIETVVNNTRILFPKNDNELQNRVKKLSSFTFRLLDLLRQWKLKQLLTEMSKLQSNPRNVQVRDFGIFLREVYRPLIVMSHLSPPNIDYAFEKLYRVMFLQNPTAETEKQREKISAAVSALDYTRTRISRFLYPLMMKTLSDTYLPYEEFWQQYHGKVMTFLGLTEADILKEPKSSDSSDNTTDEASQSQEAQNNDDDGKSDLEKQLGIDLDDPDALKKKKEPKKRDPFEQKAMEKGLGALETLFPKAGWDRLDSYPDFLPYFSAILDFEKGSEIISPRDPAQLALVLCRVMTEFMSAFRALHLKESWNPISPILEKWPRAVEDSFYKNYITRIETYAGMFDSAKTKPRTNYALSLLNDIQWVRHYYLFPYYDYKSGIPASFSKARKDINAIYPLVRQLRDALTELAEDIDAVSDHGIIGPDAICLKISNPGEPYSFEIENPISKRLKALLPAARRTNVNLIFFALAVATVLDDHINNPASVAYTSDSDVVFRSIDNKGMEPVLWVERRTDVNEIFKQSIADKKANK